MSRPIPTVAYRAKAKRLKTLWTQLKRDLGLTQITASKQLGMSQPTLSQYLNAVIPLNTDTVFKFAELLRVDPVEIDPSLKDVHSLRSYRDTKLEKVRVPYIGSTSGKAVMGEAALLTEPLPEEGTYVGVLVDSASYLEAGIPRGSSVILDLNAEPFVQHRNVAIRARGGDGFHLYKYIDSTQTTIRVHDLADDGRLRSIRMAQVAAIHLVYQITMPR